MLMRFHICHRNFLHTGFFDEASRSAWSGSNTILNKIQASFDFTEKGFDYCSKICSTLISAFPGTSAPCVLFFSFLILNWHVIKYVLHIALALSNGLFLSIVERGDDLIERERQEATRQNIDTIHGNIIQTFNLGQQLKTLLEESWKV